MIDSSYDTERKNADYERSYFTKVCCTYCALRLQNLFVLVVLKLHVALTQSSATIRSDLGFMENILWFFCFLTLLSFVKNREVYPSNIPKFLNRHRSYSKSSFQSRQVARDVFISVRKLGLDEFI